MKFYSHRSFPSYENIRERVNGRQRKRTKIKIDRDTWLNLEKDGVSLTYQFWPTRVETILTYREDHIEVHLPDLGHERTSVINRLARVFGEYNMWVDTITAGPHKGKIGVMYRGWPGWTHTMTRHEYREQLATRSLAAIPLTRGEKVRIGYNGADKDKLIIPVAEQAKLHTTWKKRSLVATNRADILSILGFGAAFWQNGYPIPKSMTIETAKVLRAMAESAGYRDVEHAWRQEVFIGGNMSPQDTEMFGEGLANMFVDYHKNKNKKKEN